LFVKINSEEGLNPSHGAPSHQKMNHAWVDPFIAPDSNVQISFLGYSNYSAAINVSTDLLSWSPLTNFPPTNGPVQFPDLGATNYPQRFYRVVWTP
jgi:hypothetical protein